MHRPESLLASALVATLALGGCAAGALENAPARADAPWHPATDAAGEIVYGKPAPGDGSWLLPANPALAAVSAVPAALAPGHPFTLAELIDIAQSSHPETRVAWADARRAALAAGIARSTYLPHVTASTIGGHRSSHGDHDALGARVDDSASGSGTVSALSLEWLLFDFGERGAVLEQAQQASIASNIAFTAAHQRVIHQVALAFYADAAARARLATSVQALANARDVEAAAGERLAHGVGTVLETSQSRLATAQAELARIQAGGRAQDARLALVAAMGVSPLARFDVEDVSQRRLPAASDSGIEAIVEGALARRPDVLGAHVAEKASAAGIRAAEAAFKPKVFLAMTGAYGSGHLAATTVPPVDQQAGTFNLGGQHWGSTVLVGVTVPLYDGGLRSALLGQARAGADAAGATSERVRDEAAREVVAAQNALATSLAANDAASALQQAARTGYDAALDAYRQGVGTITALTAAATQLLQAQDAAADAHSGALSAAATLAFATGAPGASPH